MTPSSPPPAVHDDFEAEVRAMLARRSADVTPTPAGPRREADPGAIPSTTPHAWAAPARRRLVAAVAAATLVAGVATFAVARTSSPTVDTTVGTPSGPDPIIWPLDDGIARALTEPGDAASAYLSEVVRMDPSERGAPPVAWPPEVDGDEATVHYTVGDLAGDLALRRDGDLWGVTSASSDAVRIDAAEAVDGHIDVVVELGAAVVEGTAVRVSSIDADGTAVTEDLTGFVVAASDGGDALEPPSGEPIAPDDPGGRTFTVEAPLGLPRPAVAVRVDVLRLRDDPASPRVVIAQASIPVATPGSVSPR